MPVMRHFFIAAAVCAAILALPFMAQAKRVEPDKAEKLAQRFAESKHGPGARDNIRLRHTARRHGQRPGGRMGVMPQNAQEDDAVYYYVFNINEAARGGFVIVAGDDIARPVLGYSSNGNYDENNLPPNFTYWMDHLSQQIAQAQDQGIGQDALVRQEWENYLTGNMPAEGSAAGPLVQSKWNQRAPYNNMCPLDGGVRSYTGCGATAMAQIMHYHRWPARGRGQSTAYATATRGISVPSVNFEIDYDWQNILDTYPSTNTAAGIPENDAVAALIYHVGVSIRMDYTANSSMSNTRDIPGALINYFGYHSGAQALQRTSYTDGNWMDLMRAQIDAGLPVIYRGEGIDAHIFIMDGYDDTDRLHFNWGWGGSYDGFYLTTAMTPGVFSYHGVQWGVINILPNVEGLTYPVIASHPQNLTIQTGQTAQFTVAANLNGADSLKYQWQLSTGNASAPASDTIFHENFEGINSFTLVNGSQTNRWSVGTDVFMAGGTRSAYISNTNGSKNNYDTLSPSVVHMYRDVTFPQLSGPCTLWFNIKGMNDLDNYLSVHWVTTSVTPTAGNLVEGTWWQWQNRQYSSWTRTFIPVSESYSGTTMRLVFTWRNSASGDVNPPAAVDNITLISKPGRSPFSNIPNATSATYSFRLASETMSGNRYRCIVTNNHGLSVTSNPAALTVNAENTTSVLLTDRTVPRVLPQDNGAAAVFNNMQTNQFTAGPNPAARLSGAVNFFRLGSQIQSAALTVFDASGNVINRNIIIKDAAAVTQTRRQVGSWDLTDTKGRQIADGTYLVRGVITDINGKKERISFIVGVR